MASLRYRGSSCSYTQNQQCFTVISHVFLKEKRGKRGNSIELTWGKGIPSAYG